MDRPTRDSVLFYLIFGTLLLSDISLLHCYMQEVRIRMICANKALEPLLQGKGRLKGARLKQAAFYSPFEQTMV